MKRSGGAQSWAAGDSASCIAHSKVVESDLHTSMEQDRRGLIPRAIDSLFKLVEERKENA